MNQQDRFEYRSVDTTLNTVLIVGGAVVLALSVVAWVVHALST